MTKSWTFKDYYNNQVTLSFDNHPFSTNPMHVWVISRYEDNWLLTKHSDRGLEFPGGKVEEGESPEAAAIREVYEETGGIVGELYYLGQYKVLGKNDTIVKNVYSATIEKLENKHDYMETQGPVLLKVMPQDIKTNQSFSFMMKDDVLKHCMNYLITQNK